MQSGSLNWPDFWVLACISTASSPQNEWFEAALPGWMPSWSAALTAPVLTEMSSGRKKGEVRKPVHLLHVPNAAHTALAPEAAYWWEQLRIPGKTGAHGNVPVFNGAWCQTDLQDLCPYELGRWDTLFLTVSITASRADQPIQAAVPMSLLPREHGMWMSSACKDNSGTFAESHLGCQNSGVSQETSLQN